VLATDDGRLAGTVGEIGVFSLNCHKHIQCGEGGMCVTDDDELATRLRLIRNHGENVVEHLDIAKIANLVGFNFRPTELGAAVARAQLEAIDEHVGRRERLAARLTEGAGGLAGLTPPRVRPGCRHVFYLWTLRVDEEALGLSRDLFSRALAAEGFPNFTGYVRPLYLLPLFQERSAFGGADHPIRRAAVSYEPGLCPVAERLYRAELLCVETCMYDVDETTEGLLVEALQKVHACRHALHDDPRELAVAAHRGQH
jgi:dTDP-4-amino-4,6-dideoxygalactose transaminase